MKNTKMLAELVMENKMHEKIKLLVISALAKCDVKKMTPLSSSVHNGESVDIPLEFAEKFAELIVQECEQVLFEKAEGRIIGDEVDVAGILNKHFGIK